MKRQRCHDCGVLEGQHHKPGCNMESCSFCGEPGFIGCMCAFEQLDLFADEYGEETDFLPPEIYENGLTEELESKWTDMIVEKGRIPYIDYPILCAKCGIAWPEFFRVSDEEWQHYIEPQIRDKVICIDCYQFIKKVIDKAARHRIVEARQ